jgi:hypothetical protein
MVGPACYAAFDRVLHWPLIVCLRPEADTRVSHYRRSVSERTGQPPFARHALQGMRASLFERDA